MKIDYISDLHLDMYERCESFNIENFVDTVFPRIEDGRVLVIAGDLTHNNYTLPRFFNLLSERYQKVLIVLGNHDLYMVPQYLYEGLDYSVDRVVQLEEICDRYSNIHLLNGNYIDIEGVTFFGMTGWYDGKFAYEHFGFTQSVVNKWFNKILNDSRMIRFVSGKQDFDFLHHKEASALNEEITKKADIVISHMNPSISKEHQVPMFKDEVSTTFYCFDGSELVNKLSPKYWIYGHTHSVNNYENMGTKFLCNPYGYPFEDNGVLKVNTIEV